MKLAIIFFACIISGRVYAGNINVDTIIVQNDTSICAGNSLTLSLNYPAITGRSIFPPGSDFEYSFDMPSAGWTTQMGGWPVGGAPFGNVTDGDPPEFDYNTYWQANVPDHPDGYDLYVRKEIDLTGYDLSNIHWYIGVDNAYALFLNGTLISSGYDGGYTYRWEYKGILPLSLLNPGNNIIAVALMDNGGYTTFDMMLESLPHCPCPTILWSTGDTTTSIQVTPSQTTKYFVTIRDGLVTNRDSVTVTVGNTSLRQINATICQGESYSGHSVEGNYSDTLVSKIGCDSIVTLHLNVLTKPQPKLGVSALICERDSLMLYPGQFDTYTWQDGSHQNRFIANRPGLYTVQVTNSCGSASSQVQVTMKECEITFPSAFTPNNDGKNDLFKILGANNLKDFRLSVYNRWGETVFETNDFTKGWSGKVKGQLPDSGIFIWYCEFNKPGNVNRIKMKGTVMLIR